MIVFDTLFIILIIYIFIYCVYQLFFSIGAKKLDIYFNELEKSRCEAKDEKNLCVVIFANYKNKNLDNLLSALNTQTYTKEKYQVHVVYQKDENDTSISRDFAYGAQIHNIQNPDYFSKDKAMNLFLDKMLDDETIDAYVFVGAFSCLFGWKVIQQTSPLANKMSPGFSPGIAPKIGTMAASTVKSGVSKLTKPARGAMSEMWHDAGGVVGIVSSPVALVGELADAAGRGLNKGGHTGWGKAASGVGKVLKFPHKAAKFVHKTYKDNKPPK